MGMVRLRLGEGIELPDNVALGSANRFVSLNEKVPAFEQDHRCGRSGTGGPPLHHLLIAVALLAAVGLDLIFVTFSGEPSAALTFALLSYFIMLLLSGSAGSYVPDMQDYTTFLGPLVREGTRGFVSRLLLAYSVPAVLLLMVAFIPSLGALSPQRHRPIGFHVGGILALDVLGLGGSGPRVPLAPQRSIPGGDRGRVGGIDSRPVELGQSRRRPGRTAIGFIHLDGMGVYLPHRSLGRVTAA